MSKELLPDVFRKNLKIIFCGMAAGELSARVGGYYANKNNIFWKTLDDLGFTGERIKSCNYKEVLKDKLGLTDLVKNQSGIGNKINCTENDIKILKQKISDWKPKILAFNGKRPVRIFIKREYIDWGKQKDKIGKTKIWILPSTSGLNGMWNRYNHEKIWKDLYQNIMG